MKHKNAKRLSSNKLNLKHHYQNMLKYLQQKHTPKTPEIVEENIVYPSRRTRRNIATRNRNGDGTGISQLQQVGVGSTPLKEHHSKDKEKEQVVDYCQ
jgi:hypothetical protein